MRLLVVTHYFPAHRGGIEILAWELAKRLYARGIEIAWAASDVDPPPGLLRCVPMRAWNITERRLGFPYPLWSIGSLPRLRQLVSWADVVHIHDSLYFGNVAAAVMAGRLGKPVLVTQQVAEVPYRNPALRNLMRAANRTVARRVLSRCGRAVFVSPRVRRYFEQLVNFRRPPLVIPNGVDTRTFYPIADSQRAASRKRLGLSDDRMACLFVGRFVEKKGLPLIRKLAERQPSCDFLFAGWGPLDPAGWGLPNVRPLGSLAAPELATWYHAVDLLVLPSVGEGFPLVVQEAAACGTPALVTSETAEGLDAVRAFTYTCEPEFEGLNSRFETILAERDELRSRRDHAATYAARHWDWDDVAARYAKLFDELHHRKQKSRR